MGNEKIFLLGGDDIGVANFFSRLRGASFDNRYGYGRRRCNGSAFGGEESQRHNRRRNGFGGQCQFGASRSKRVDDSGSCRREYLPSSILNKDGKSFIAARESILKNFYIRAIVQLGSKTFGATGTNTVIMFLERFDGPPRKLADYEDVAATILEGRPLGRKFSREILDGYLKKTGKTLENLTEDDRERIIYFGLTFKQMTLIISAPDDVKAQEKFLGYGWSNAKGREGIVHKKRGGFLFDNDNRAAENTLAAVIHAVFDEKQLKIAALEEYYHYSTLADMLDFYSNKFTKTITLAKPNYAPEEYKGDFELVKLGDIAPFVTERTTIDEINLADFVTTDNMLKDKRGIKLYEGIPQISGLVKYLKGDILISNIRPYLKKIWLADRAGGCSPDVLVFRSRDDKILLSEYLFEVLKQDDFFDFAMATAKGMKMPRGDKDKIKSYKIPLPPIEIQKKIVAEFDSIAAQTAQAEENIQNLDAAIKNKFAELFVGKNFPVKRLGEICKVARGGSPRPINDYITDAENGINWIKIGDATENSRYITKTAQRIKSEGKSKSRYVKAGDFLLSNSMTFGKPYILKIDGCIHDGWLVLDYNKDILEENYFHAYLSSSSAYKIMSGMASGSVVSNLNSEIIKKLPVPLPPLEMQKEFAEYVENCESMKKSARKQLEELKLEREELVRKYFR